jgi:UDP-2,3-diacylglucosamine pyrophosphatase LpxH
VRREALTPLNPPAATITAGWGSAVPNDETPGDDAPPRLRVRTVWISDIHLGTPGCQARALLDFLRDVECETLFLVGDIIDGWQLRRQWYWPQAHNDVVQKVLRKARKGTKVLFVPGNHDEFARRYIGHSFGGVDVVEEWIHVTADGRRLWVTHGDLFDGVVQCARWLALLGDQAYEFTLRLNRHLNSWRARLGLPYWSLSSYLKLRVKRAVSYVSDFEVALAREAYKRGVDGVVCGHIHHAEMREIGGVLYANDGDWVESLTALVEHADGRLEIIDRSGMREVLASRRAKTEATLPPGPAVPVGVTTTAMPAGVAIAAASAGAGATATPPALLPSLPAQGLEEDATALGAEREGAVL